MLEKIKQFIESSKGRDIFSVAIVVLVGLSSFGLGRLSKNPDEQSIKISYPSMEGAQLSAFSDQDLAQDQGQGQVSTQNKARVPAVSSSVGKSFFASKRGHKYYSIGCSAGKSIKMENRVYFATNTDAEKAGFELSSSCH